MPPPNNDPSLTCITEIAVAEVKIQSVLEDGQWQFMNGDRCICYQCSATSIDDRFARRCLVSPKITLTLTLVSSTSSDSNLGICFNEDA